MGRRSRGRTHQGFTLVELVVAVLIFTTVTIAIFGALLAAQALAERSKNLTAAVTDARTVMEQIRRDVQTSADMVAFAASFPETTYEDWVVDQQAKGLGFGNLTDEAVDVTYGHVGEDPLDVTVSVTWMERGGRSRTTTLQTQMTRR